MSTTAAATTDSAPKTAKRRKLTDKSIPISLTEFEDSRMYLDLLEAERKLDWSMTRKRMEIQDVFNKPSLVPRTLRVFLSHSVENQAWQISEGGFSLDPRSLNMGTGQGIPRWTFKVEGRLLDVPGQKPHASRVSPRKFSSFLKGLVIEFDRDPTIYPDGNIVEWRAPVAHTGAQAHPDQDGFVITRPGDVNVRARVTLHLKLLPERFKLIDPLVEILDMKEDTRTGIVTALWHYIKVNGLQDKVDRKIIRPDAKLRPIVGVEQLTFHQLPEVLNRCIKPMDPVILHHTINVGPSTSNNMQVFDIEIPLDDSALKAKMSAIHSYSGGDLAKQVAAFDDEIAIAAQSIRNSKARLDFLKSLAADPASFIQAWLASQSRDLDIVLGNEQGVKEEDLKNSKFFGEPWVDEAVSIQEGLRITNALRASQGTL